MSEYQPIGEINFRPCGDLIILDFRQDDRTTSGGLIIPDVAMKGELREAVVVAAGPGKYENGILIPMCVKPGDRVVFNAFEGSTVMVGNKKVFGINQKNIWGVIE